MELKNYEAYGVVCDIMEERTLWTQEDLVEMSGYAQGYVSQILDAMQQRGEVISMQIETGLPGKSGRINMYEKVGA